VKGFYDSMYIFYDVDGMSSIFNIWDGDLNVGYTCIIYGVLGGVFLIRGIVWG
jgi:hypothetical protein